MRLPSYLQVSPYGIYYFRSVFPKPIQVILNRREFKRSLKTTCLYNAIHLSRTFKVHLHKNYFIIQKHKMDWQQTQVLLDKIANSIISDFRDYVAINGAYPDNIRNYPERQAEEDAYYYLSMKQFPLDHCDINLSDDEIEKRYGLESKPAEDIRWRRSGAKLSSINSIHNYANTIIEEIGLKIDSGDLELFCQKVAEMLWRTKLLREDLVSEYLQPDKSNRQQNNTQLITKAPNKPTGIFSQVIPNNNLSILFEDHLLRKINSDDDIDQNFEPNYRQKFKLTYEILKYCMQVNTDEDIWLDDVTRTHVTRLKKIVERWPNRSSSRLKNYSVYEICEFIELQSTSHLPQEVQESLEKKISIPTMINYSSPLRSTVEQAKEDAIVETNVFEHFSYKKPKKYRKSKEGKPFNYSVTI